MKTIEGRGRTVRQINEAIRRLIDAGEREILVRHPGARHNLAVALIARPVNWITIEPAT